MEDIATVLPDRIYALGFSAWKRPIVRRFLQGRELRFVRRAQSVPAGATLAVWGSKAVCPSLRPNIKVIRLEDGFLRSVGLGADLVQPLSWVVDTRGVYYDATRESDVEYLLQKASFDAALLERAAVLRKRLVESGITKYNVGSQRWQRPARTCRVILVPGQVESDASIALGAPGIRTNMDLLRAVRQSNPDAYIVYKPHPDVVAGLRARGNGEHDATALADEIVVDSAMADMLPQVDEVHVLTSLAGFEALLRHKAVTAYGQPFYAGWGLTKDVVPVTRRTRRLALDDLVAAVLILYPRYISRVSGQLITVESALDELSAWRDAAPVRMTLRRRLMRPVLRWAARFR
ncbi:capsular polysaccharide export protein, LipB/KpsS family [Dyella soli]|uniref:Beta-3-deoxy-D-manno-oct-2-ulosonic acid transferase n=1 Tax=Dyella soli TaxID=522319 RepID=A0A4R0YSQ2_9GAMM|nr:beta-3-deoxy-D-manno-oct-2-ulosonic acid transferase [Dyella soli]TCI08962.1 beta-3-deoxy-D-manno-oct-2-ulosonic acid transferase [Dyella soli]